MWTPRSVHFFPTRHARPPKRSASTLNAPNQANADADHDSEVCFEVTQCLICFIALSNFLSLQSEVDTVFMLNAADTRALLIALAAVRALFKDSRHAEVATSRGD